MLVELALGRPVADLGDRPLALGVARRVAGEAEGAVDLGHPAVGRRPQRGHRVAARRHGVAGGDEVRVEDRVDVARRGHLHGDLLDAPAALFLPALSRPQQRVGEAAGREGAGRDRRERQRLQDRVQAADRAARVGEQRRRGQLAVRGRTQVGDLVGDRERLGGVVEMQQRRVAEDRVAVAHLAHTHIAAGRDVLDLARHVPVEQGHAAVDLAGDRIAQQDVQRPAAGVLGVRGTRRVPQRGAQVILRRRRRPERRERGGVVITRRLRSEEGLGDLRAGGELRLRPAGRGRRHRRAGVVDERDGGRRAGEQRKRGDHSGDADTCGGRFGGERCDERGTRGERPKPAPPLRADHPHAAIVGFRTSRPHEQSPPLRLRDIATARCRN